MGLSQEEMAVKLWVSRNYISLLEGGQKKPSSKLIERVAFIERGIDLIDAIKTGEKMQDSQVQYSGHLE